MPTPDESDMTAAELALGVLAGEERAAALRRVLAEPAFAREVQGWRDRLATLFLDWPAAEVRPEFAARVAAIPDAGGNANAGWRWTAAATSMVAAVLLGILVLRPAPTPVEPAPVAKPARPPLVAVLKPETGEPFGLLFDPGTREVRLNGAVRVPARRVAELWAIGADGRPRTAGLLGARPSARLVLAPGLPAEAGTTFAISIEPLGGSPKATPTGPVVATGKLAAI